jgi:hypothetical protein
VFESRLAELKEDVEFRRASPHYLSDHSADADAQNEFKRLADRFGATAIDGVFEGLFAETASKQIPEARNRLRDVSLLDSLSMHTTVHRRSILATLGADADSVTLGYYDKMLRFPANVRSCLEAVVTSAAFVPNDLPGDISPNEKLAVVRVLLREGLLTLTPES